MGFFDLFAGRNKPVTPKPATSPAPTPAAPAPAASTPPPSPAAASKEPASPSTPGALKQKLIDARRRLEARDLPAATALYEEVLAQAGDRADVLVTISGDLGACGFIEPIIELIAPRYDAERHGPATGLNLLQAYLLTRNPEPAQHLLDILFALEKPELAERLHGFSNALAELIEGQRRGLIPPPGAPEATEEGKIAPPEIQKARSVALASISKPIWAYGVEAVPALLPPAKEGRLRRVGFAQVALVGEIKGLDAPESALTRFARGLPLWFAETFYFSPHYAPIAALGMMGQERLVSFPTEWTADNIRQLVDTATGGLDYVFTAALRRQGGETTLTLKVWEVKKLKERKQFAASWQGEDADPALRSLMEQVRLFMEWQPYPGGPTPSSPVSPWSWCDSLAHSAHLFLADKAVVPAPAEGVAETAAALAVRARESELDAVLWLTALDRARRLGLESQFPAGAQPHGGERVDAAKAVLSL